MFHRRRYQKRPIFLPLVLFHWMARSDPAAGLLSAGWTAPCAISGSPRGSRTAGYPALSRPHNQPAGCIADTPGAPAQTTPPEYSLPSCFL